MRTTPRTLVALTGAATLLLAGLAGCGSKSNSSSGSTPTNTKVGILLPDTASSPRWVSADPNELNKQCIAYKLTCYIDNANGSATTQQSQALINEGVGVLLITDRLDPLRPVAQEFVESHVAEHAPSLTHHHVPVKRRWNAMERHVGMRIALATLAAATALAAAATVTAAHASSRKPTVATVADAANGLPSGKRMHKPF